MTATAADAQTALEAAEDTKVGNFIHTLLIDKKMPLLGIRWHGEVFVDAPLNHEPEGADITLRRAQAALSRSFGPNWSGRMTLKFNDANKVKTGDSFLRYSAWKTSVLDIGIFDPAFSLESMNQTAGLTFMERSLPVVALSENKSGGLGILKRTANSILNANFFFFSTSQDDQTQPGKAVVLHYAHAPITFRHTEDINIGASFSYRFDVNPQRTKFRSRPEIATSDDFYVDTSPIANADKVLRFGFDAHKEWGPLSWQSEVLFTEVQRSGQDSEMGNDMGSLRFWGTYSYLSWFLSNDRRNFEAGRGEFLAMEPGNPVGRGGKGAFELALRASYVDLSDQDVIGGQQSNLTLGFNWYLNAHFRVMTNLTKVLDVDRPGSEFDGLDPLILSMRLQWQML